jgi:hypothetical protein
LLRNRVENAVEKNRAKRQAATQRARLRSIVDNAPVVLFTLSTGKALESLGLARGGFPAGGDRHRSNRLELAGKILLN